VADLDVSIVIPCRNEEATIAACVDTAFEALHGAGVCGEVLVVDNDSTDATATLARSAGARVVFEPQHGYGSAYLAGLTAARGRAILMGDGDGTYDFAELPRFLARVDAGADMVLGSRLRGRILPGAMPWHHRWIGNPVLTGVLNLVVGTHVSDAHCGLRMIRSQALDRLDLTSTGMEFASEMVIEAGAAGLRIDETPIVYAPRPEAGGSKLRSIRDGLRHLRLIAGYAPREVFLVPTALLGAAGIGLLAVGANDPIELAGAFTVAASGVGADLARTVPSRGRSARPAAHERRRRTFRPLSVALRFAVALGAVAAAVAVLGERRAPPLTSEAGRIVVAMLALSVVALVQVLWAVRFQRKAPPPRG